MLKEFCAENHTDVAMAIAKGAGRIELCDNLAVGGTTPSLGVIEHVCQLGNERQVPVLVIIRPRGGDFCYDQAELDMMVADIRAARKAGASGFVFGALTETGQLDQEAMRLLLGEVKGEETVFHMAFDELTHPDQLEAIDWLAQAGVTRILTHGGAMNRAIEDNLPWLHQLVQQASGKIEVIIGGGVTADNAEKLAETLGINQVHGTKIVSR